MRTLLKLRINQHFKDCCEILIIIFGVSFILLIYYFFFIFNNSLLGKDKTTNFIHSFSLFENVYHNYNITKNYVRIVSDNNTLYVNKLQKFLTEVEKIKHVEIYNNSKDLYELLKKSYYSEKNSTSLTIQLDIKKNNDIEEINFLFKIWELTKKKIKKSKNEFYITLNCENKYKSLERIKIFANYQKIITNFITYIKSNSKNNNLKVIVESSQFINVPDEKLYETKNKNKTWIILFSLWISIMIVANYNGLYNERKTNSIDLLYKFGIKSYQNIISLFIICSFFIFFYGIFEFLIFEKIFFDFTFMSIILSLIAIFFFLIQNFIFVLVFDNLFRKNDFTNHLFFFMLLINIIFFITNGFNFSTSNLNRIILIIPNIWFIMIFFNIMEINYFETFSLELLKMNGFEEFNYIDYIKYSIISTIVYFILIILTSLIYKLISYCNCCKKNNIVKDYEILELKEKNEKYHQKLNQEEENYKKQNNYLRIENLTKKYEDIIAINNFSFDFFPNEIFCLIGHNGAGKTTLINMICGLEKPNNGEIKFKNESLINNKKFLYENVEICDEKYYLFQESTINEYIEYLLKLKGTYENEEKISNLLKELNLENKKISRLTNDDKKKLNVITSFLGNNKIILLDEPTSDVNRETRDLICNFLKKNKKDKIIIFTTHSLEETDFLADKIGIIKDGKMICSGTTTFIKDIYSNSFNLNLIIDSKINEESKNQFINQINQYCDQCKIKIYSNSLLQLNISNADLDIFFEYLNVQGKDILNITNYSISTTTLEDIFIFINEKENKDNENDYNIIDSIGINADNQINNQNKNNNNNELNNNLFLNIKRNVKMIWNINNIIYQLLSIFLFLILFHEGKINLIDNEDFINIEELLRKNEIIIYTNNIDYINNSYYLKNIENKIKFSNITNFNNISDFANFIKNNSKLRNERSAILFKKENEIIKIYNLYQGSAPDYFQATMNMLINIITEKEFNLYINSGKKYGDLNVFIYLNDKNLYIYCFVIEIIILFIIYSSHIPFKEKKNNTKHLLYLNGNSKFNYWIGIFMSDFLRIILYIIVMFIFFYIHEFNYNILINITLCLFASCMFIYLISLYFCETSIFLFFVYIHIFIIIVMILSYLMLFFYFDNSFKINQFFFQNIGLLKNKNYIFTISDICPLTSLCTLFIRLLINDNSIHDEGSKNDNLLFVYKIIFCIQIILYGVLFYLIESKSENKKKNVETNELIHSLISEENILNNRNSDLINNDTSTDISLNIKNLTIFEKKSIFSKIFSKKEKKKIIDNLNLELKKNEKFGLLGKSGSGKSIILKSIIQENNNYLGEILLFNKNIKENFNSFRNQIGYCPQENILINEITVIDFLNFYKGLKINSNEIKDDLNFLINLLGLKEYLNKKCNHLSKGNKRKLCFIISILKNPKLLLLDNPTVGIDTKSRKLIWKYLKKLDHKYNMILVSNDIEEIEYLCDQISILKKGQLNINENIEKLKMKYSIGYFFKLDIKKENNIYENNDDLFEKLIKKIKNLDKLDNDFKNDYECLYKLNQIIEYLGNNYRDIEFNNSYYDNYSLQFIIQIDDEKKGTLFALILNLKNKFNFILDFSIQNESLEKIIPDLYDS